MNTKYGSFHFVFSPEVPDECFVEKVGLCVGAALMIWTQWVGKFLCFGYFYGALDIIYLFSLCWHCVLGVQGLFYDVYTIDG